MNRTLALLASLLLPAAAFLAAAGTAEASWRLDAGRFAASAHGDLACADCHADLAGRAGHPDPARVNRAPGADFNPAACFSCHPGAEAEAAAGSHGKVAAAPERLARCLTCHNPHTVGSAGKPPAAGSFGAEDRACLACHARPAAEAAAEANAFLCLSCHAAPGRGADTPLLDPAAYAATPHAGQDCLTCHPRADASPHTAMGQADCASCHAPHPEATAHDAHLGVACQACHLPGAVPERQGRAVTWKLTPAAGRISDAHAMRLTGEQECARCHRPGNGLGAAARVLPAKGVLCLACHSGSFTAADTVSALSLAGFGGGTLLLLALGVSAAGGLAAARRGLAWPSARHLGSRLGALAEALLLDVLCQRRLWRRSRSRWAVHALIFYPFALRCLWGLAAWAGSRWAPGADATLALLDKNAPLGAFLFDLTGAMLLAGLVLAWRRGTKADRDLLPGLPGQDRLALGLLLGVTLAGFLLEGMRMALTGADGGAAFLGYILSRPLAGAGWLEEAYGWFWYLHAALWGAVVAYLPFSKLMHVILAPLVLAVRSMGAARPGHHD